MLFLSESDRKDQLQSTSSEPEIDMSKYKNDPKYACTYMEIPQHDINKAERDFGLFGPTETSAAAKESGQTK